MPLCLKTVSPETGQIAGVMAPQNFLPQKMKFSEGAVKLCDSETFN